jgi:hypothetical protein
MLTIVFLIAALTKAADAQKKFLRSSAIVF